MSNENLLCVDSCMRAKCSWSTTINLIEDALPFVIINFGFSIVNVDTDPKDNQAGCLA